MPRTNYIWDEVNDTLLAETDANGNAIAEYTNEPGQFGPLLSQRRNGHTYYHHYDGLGSTRALTDESGEVTDTYTYDAWGNEVSHSGASANPFRWVGQKGYFFDLDVGTFYIRARSYDPVVGRWIAQDPASLRPGAESVTSYHLTTALFNSRHLIGNSNAGGRGYSYCADNPLAHADASGLELESPGKCSISNILAWAYHHHEPSIRPRMPFPGCCSIDFDAFTSIALRQFDCHFGDLEELRRRGCVGLAEYHAKARGCPAPAWPERIAGARCFDAAQGGSITADRLKCPAGYGKVMITKQGKWNEGQPAPIPGGLPGEVACGSMGENPTGTNFNYIVQIGGFWLYMDEGRHFLGSSPTLVVCRIDPTPLELGGNAHSMQIVACCCKSRPPPSERPTIP